jgi:signal transduction histidine kinase
LLPVERISSATRLAGVRLLRLRWPYRPEVLDIAWGVFSAGNLVAIVFWCGWETIPFYFIWISFTVLYGFRTWSTRPTVVLLTGVTVTTAAGIGLDVYRGAEPPAELIEVPLMAAMFGAMVWHARRKVAAEHDYHLVSEENVRLLANQRRFLQDASHQLRTPITIALGHAELLAPAIVDKQAGDDVRVLLGELNRLRRISEQLLVIAAAEDPEFLRMEPVALDLLTMDVIRRWRPTATRRWQIGHLDQITVLADTERLEMAIDALLENAVRHTGDNDLVGLSVIRGWQSRQARLIVADSGTGIPADQVHLIFDRFRTGDSRARGTGLGLSLVRAVARAHGGDVRVRSTVGEGSEFEILLPAAPAVASPPPTPGSSAAVDTDGNLAGSSRRADGLLVAGGHIEVGAEAQARHWRGRGGRDCGGGPERRHLGFERRDAAFGCPGGVV